MCGADCAKASRSLHSRRTSTMWVMPSSQISANCIAASSSSKALMSPPMASLGVTKSRLANSALGRVCNGVSCRYAPSRVTHTAELCKGRIHVGRELGRFLEHRRHELGLSRRELAERSELPYPYVSQLETGDREPS